MVKNNTKAKSDRDKFYEFHMINQHFINYFIFFNYHTLFLGCTSIEKEGSFNSSALLKGLQRKSKDLGATFVEAEVIGFDMEAQRDTLMEGVTPGTFKKIKGVQYKTKDNEEYTLKFAVCVIAAGTNTNDIAKLASIGTGDGLLQVPLPLEKRYTFIFEYVVPCKVINGC